MERKGLSCAVWDLKPQFRMISNFRSMWLRGEHADLPRSRSRSCSFGGASSFEDSSSWRPVSSPSSSNGAGLSSLNSRLKTERSPAQYRPIEPDSRVDHSTPVQACSHADLLLPAEKACQMPAAKPPGHRRQARMYEYSHLSLSQNLSEIGTYSSTTYGKKI